MDPRYISLVASCPERKSLAVALAIRGIRGSLGFNIELKAFPVDGRLVVLPPDTDDNNARNGK